MMKRMAAVVLAAALVLPSCVLGFENESIVYAAEEEKQEIPEGYTPIYDIADLYAIRNDLEGDYILMNDIDMTEDTSEGGDYDCGTGWDSIEQFGGVLDGNGHRIIGMHIFGEFGFCRVGLFEENFGTIQNLGMVDCEIDVNVQEGSLGALAGRSAGNILNCYSSGRIIAKGGGEEGTISIGGVAGQLVSARNDNDDGWILGVINNCYNICEIDGMGMSDNCEVNLGGICGEWSDSRIAHSYNIGNIRKNDSGQWCYAGGICGSAIQTDYELESCKYLKGTANRGTGDREDNENCLSLSEAQMKNAKTYTGYNFTDTWEIDPYCSYRYPQLKNNRMVRVGSIQLKAIPEKLVYDQGEVLLTEGSQLGITYEDGIQTGIPLSLDMLSGYDMMQIGTQTVTVVYGGIKTSFDIEVKEIPVSSITMPEKLSIPRSGSDLLKPEIMPENASNQTLIWKSSDESIVSVDDKGMLKAKAAGTVIITAETSNGLTASCKVTVLVPAVSIQLSSDTLTLKKGENHTISATLVPFESTEGITWSSNNETVASVDSSGLVQANARGTAKITATSSMGLVASCTVTVTVPAVSVQLNQTSIVLKEGESQNIIARLSPNDSTDTIKWRSENPVVAVVLNGRITAKNAGTAVIAAYTENGVQAVCKVTVQKKSAPQTSGNHSSTGGNPNNGTSDTANNDNLIRNVSSIKTKIKSAKNTKTKSIKLKLGGLSSCDGYQIQYGTKKNFKGAKTITNKSNSVTIKKLKLKKTYYIRARVYKKIAGVPYYGTWSKRKKVKIKK